mmetsp:Transcript_33033/g.78054  ORF Transcript_33033/g.78054 Transcript_33033/m.78054 type:complete len:82 (+) Transcript_33033:348-593(+)
MQRIPSSNTECASFPGTAYQHARETKGEYIRHEQQYGTWTTRLDDEHRKNPTVLNGWSSFPDNAYKQYVYNSIASIDTIVL